MRTRPLLNVVLPTAVVIAWPLLSALLIGILPLGGLLSPTAEQIARSLLFGVVCLLPPLLSASSYIGAGHLTAWVGSGLMAAGAISSGLFGSSPYAASWLWGVVVAALVEEIIFRVVLPRWLEERSIFGQTTVGGILAVLVPQLTFAACHLLPVTQGWSGSWGSRFVHLTTVGLAYSVLVRSAGLGFCVSIHAAGNLSLMAGPLFSPRRRSFGELIVWLVLLTCLVGLHRSQCEARIVKTYVSPT